MTWIRGRHPWKLITLLILACTVLAAYNVYVAHSNTLPSTQWELQSPNHSKQATAAPTGTAHELNRSLPARLAIPSLHIDAPVLYMGLTKTGSMDVPSTITDTGWYKYGPLPGNTGSAVIAGHIDGLKGQPGVFADLGKLQAGDTITVTDLNGLMTSFVVQKSQTYGPNEQPDEVFHSNSGAHLNLITCTGTWDSTQHQFLQRLVVFADKQ
jgi:LPXTG-site transpeptidase (sortase) family protein